MTQGWAQRSPEQRAGDLAGLRHAVSSVSIRVLSRTEDVTVTVGAGGAVTSIEVRASALRRQVHELADTLKETIELATRQAVDAMAAGVTAISGDRGHVGVLAGQLPPVPRWADLVATAGPVQPSAESAEDADVDGRLRRSFDGYRRQLEQYAALDVTLTEQTHTTTSPDGVAAITVDGRGAIRDIRLDARAMRNCPASALGPIVLATLQRARATAALAQAEHVQQILGDRLDVRTMVAQAIGEDLREQIEQDREK